MSRRIEGFEALHCRATRAWASVAYTSHMILIKSIDKARNEMIDIEHLSEDELQMLVDKYQKVR